MLVGQAPAPCSGRVCALEQTIRGLAEKKTDTVVGSSFDSLLGEVTTRICTPGYVGC